MKVLYFAQYKEQLGCANEEIEGLQQVATVSDLIRLLAGRGGAWNQVFSDRRLLVSVNQEMASLEDSVSASDEVAFFPPVTGG